VENTRLEDIGEVGLTAQQLAGHHRPGRQDGVAVSVRRRAIRAIIDQ